MYSLFTKNFGITNAKNFEQFISGSFANTYVCIGRNTTWANNDTTPAAVDTANTFYELWDRMIGLKKITNADINLIIPRIDWTSGTVYVEYTQDTEIFKQNNEDDIEYINKFYVRNNRDQVFKCLFNNGGIQSTVMPELSLGGQLPENPYIQTGDGYKWKYMYTIPSGLKQKFFTSQFMPVVEEPIVYNNAVNGRLDIIKIVNAGAGFNNNANSTSLNILAVSGNGANANITARILTSANANSAYIADVNVLDGGSNYTKASITISDPLKIGGTANANLIPVIGPPGGHGSSVVAELGASSIMISVSFNADEGGVLPVDVVDQGGFRQISIIKDPLLANSAYATGSVYRATTKYNLTLPSKNFQHKEIVYVGSSLSSATFTGLVEHFDSGFNILYLNNLTGSVEPPAAITGATSGAVATILTIAEPDVKRYTGEALYIENRSEVVRSLIESQQLKLTLRF
jgi:hypothetical protein